MTYCVTVFSRYLTFMRVIILSFYTRHARLTSTNFPNVILQHLFLTPLAYNDHRISRLASNLASRRRYEEREGVCSSLPREKVKAKAVCFQDEMRPETRDPIVPVFDRPENHSPSAILFDGLLTFFSKLAGAILLYSCISCSSYNRN